jgi:N6-adenosine-specific RNA methylase IME4
MSVDDNVELAAHPLAALIPDMAPAEYEALRADIAERGLLAPVVLYEGQILDGRHRYRACREVSAEPLYTTYTGDDPVAYVVSVNIKRRHLAPSQLAVVALAVEQAYAPKARERQLAGLKQHQAVRPFSQSCQNGEPVHSATLAAKAVGVSPRYISAAKQLAREAPELLPQVGSGQLTIPEAQKALRLRKKAAQVAEITSRDTGPLASIGPFSVRLADPPWRYEDAEPSRSVENHYPTMPLDEIMALEIPAAGDAVLFLWATSSMLPEALEVMAAWGFTYRTCLVWIKDRMGMGYYVRQQDELLLVGQHGNLPHPDPEDRPSSVISAPRGLHSAKPPVVHELIERMYPALDKVELFARGPCPDGWASWGNQAGSRWVCDRNVGPIRSIQQG